MSWFRKFAHVISLVLLAAFGPFFLLLGLLGSVIHPRERDGRAKAKRDRKRETAVILPLRPAGPREPPTDPALETPPPAADAACEGSVVPFPRRKAHPR